jgi:hypothetical protein
MFACCSPFIKYRVQKYTEPNFHLPIYVYIHILLRKYTDEFAFYGHYLL